MKRLLGLCIVLFVLSSCAPPKSDQPLSDPAQAAADPALSGLWIAERKKDETDLVYLHAAPRKDGWTDLELVTHDERGITTEQFEMFPTTLEQKQIMNIRNKAAKPAEGAAQAPSARYFFARYVLKKKDELNLWLMDNDAATEAVEKGRVKGKVEKTGKIKVEGKVKEITDTTVVFQDTTENLAKFVKAAETFKLFSGDPMRFRRVPAR